MDQLLMAIVNILTQRMTLNPDDLYDKVKQRILTNYMKEQKAKEKERQGRNRIQKKLEEAAAAAAVLTPEGSAEIGEQEEGGKHDMAPRVPTGPGEDTKSAGAFPGLAMPMDTGDLRGMPHSGHRTPHSGPGAVGAPQEGTHSGPGTQGPGAGGGPGAEGAHQEGTHSGPGTQGPGAGGEPGGPPDKVRHNRSVHTIPLSEINSSVCQAMMLKCFNALQPDKFQSTVYRFCKFGPKQSFVKFQFCPDMGNFFNLMPVSLVKKISMIMDTTPEGLSAQDVNGKKLDIMGVVKVIVLTGN